MESLFCMLTVEEHIAPSCRVELDYTDMEDLLNKKLYSKTGISIATFFGGPLAAGYLIRHNYRMLGRERKGLTAIILATLFTFAIFLPVFLLPEEIVDKIPAQFIPGLYTLIIVGVVEVLQGEDLKRHKEEQRAFESNWKASGIGLLWSLVLIGLFGTYVFTSPEMNVQVDQEIAQKLEQISANEEEALKVYQLNPQSSTKEALITALKDEGIYYWNQNLKLLEEIQQYELVAAHEKYVNKLYVYTRTRQETYILMMKAIGEGTDVYAPQIEMKNKSIEVLLKELDQMTFE